MIYQSFGSLTGTSFTLAATPLSADHVMVVFLGHILRRVALSPQVGEYTLSGTALTLGMSKGASDELYLWYMTSGTQMLIPATISGLKNGSNKVFTISNSIPAGTEPILIHNALILNPTGTGVNHYARSGATFTLNASHPAPAASDSLFIYVAATNPTTAAFAPLTITVPGSAQTFYVTAAELSELEGYDKQVLVHMGGRAFEQVGVYPSANKVRAFPVNQTLHLGAMVTSTDVVAGMHTDIVSGWMTGVLASPTATFDKWLRDNRPRVAYAQLSLVKVGGSKTLLVATEAVQAEIGGANATQGFQEAFGEGAFGEGPFGLGPFGEGPFGGA